MGCTFDQLRISLSKKEYGQAFSKFWDEFFEANWDLKFRKKRNKEEYAVEIEEEPLFSIYEDGTTLDSLFLSFLKSNPESVLKAEYSNDEGLFLRYEYQNFVLTRTKVYDDEGYGTNGIDYCEECDEEFEPPIFTLANFDPSKKYLCPECGSLLNEQFTPSIEKTEFRLADNDWVIPKGYKEAKKYNSLYAAE